ncbi:MAG TPA: DUF6143 family protein [Bacillota bacterium]|nr:DUF6143 family protein [Bacillota bacterium]
MINTRDGRCGAYLPEIAGIPIDLYESMQGKFFTGYIDELRFGKGTSAWAGVFNPPDSGVNFFLWTYRIVDVLQSAYRIQIYFNAQYPGRPKVSPFVSPTNIAITPLPVSHAQVLYASQVTGEPTGGVKAFVRRGEPNVNIFSTEEGKFIMPPGGNFTIILSNPETPEIEATGKIFYMWWEEPI